jgi:hypothetical protein
MSFLVVKVNHMLGVCLAGRWEEVGVGRRRPALEGGGRRWKEGVNEESCLYIIKDSEYSVVFGKGS